MLKPIIRPQLKKLLHKSTLFCMPGHKGSLNALDITEITGADDLRRPKGILHDAQRQLAKVFNVPFAQFLVGGSSLGIHTMVKYYCDIGDTLIINDGAHVAVHNIAKILNLKTITLPINKIDNFGIAAPIMPDDVERTIKQHPDAKAVLITSPTYYGIFSDVKGIAKVCHANNIPLIVDQAHGAHFSFSHSLPPNAIEAGADACNISVHKTLPSLTQTAMLLSRVDMSEQLNLFCTTSPSYLFMMAIEEACIKMHKKGEKMIDALITNCNNFKNAIKFNTLSNNYTDPTRLVISLPGNRANEIANSLAQKRIYIEMCDGKNIVLIPSVNNTKDDFTRLAKELNQF
ncbi:MAG: aminotransferase class V-fold PLP-dependent enzyme [Clostridiales bacterium]|jgi:arginine/lysine/ornithine decarboxylase|nr:aminotransferase class V-fold PLP-dependent enzyme [Clostridiales bacterium]